MTFPEEAILFIDRDAYDYKRWGLFAVIAFNYSKTRKIKEQKDMIRTEALDACDKAIAFAHKEVDITNRKYITGELKGEPIISPDMGLISCQMTGCNNIPVGIQGVF